MRVGIDATAWVNKRGFGRFTRNVVSRLVEADPETEYLLYIDSETLRDAALPARATVREVSLSEAPTAAAAAGSSRRVSDLVRLSRAVRRDRPDVFLFPSVYTYFPVLGVPVVLGVHDAIVHELPKLTLPTRRERLAWRAKETLALRTATSVFTVSQTSCDALAARFRLSRDRLGLVPEGADDIFAPRPVAAVEGARSRIGLEPGEPFFVFAGGISPHKNVETLLHAYGHLAGERESLPRLVVVGDVGGETYVSSATSVRSLIATLGIESSVILPGFVDDETLASLYTGAEAVVIPSLAEGFGLPAVEGAACGAPMLLSDIPAHRETLDGAALFFPPRDRQALTEALSAVLDDPARAREMARHGRRRAQELSWDAAVEPLRELLTQAAGTRRNGG